MTRTYKLACVLYAGLCLGGVARGRPNLNLPQSKRDALLTTLDAVWADESSRRLHPPVGDGGKGVGPLQIWKIMVDDANRIWGDKRWTYEDREDWVKSCEIFVVITMHYEPKGKPEQWCRLWNGGPNWREKGPATDEYWAKCKAEILKGK